MKRTIKICCYLLCFTCVLFSCTRNVHNLAQQKVNFDELPLPIQDTLLVLAEQSDRSSDFIFLDTGKKYDTKRLETGPFLDGYTFRELKDGKRYKIGNGTPHPYIIYNNYLYHPLEFNAVFISSIRNELFMRYALE